jgi:subtilisin family serine protease
MSAPFVSGVAEQLLAQNPGRTPLDVKRQLAGTADKVGTPTYGSDPYATCLCT